MMSTGFDTIVDLLVENLMQNYYIKGNLHLGNVIQWDK